jgi:hypothetical protein
LVSNKRNNNRRLLAVVRGFGAVIAVGAMSTAMAGVAQAAEAPQERPAQLASLQAPTDEVGPPDAPTITLTPGGQGARVMYVAPSWNQPDLNGGELVEYHVVIKNGNGVVLRDETTQDTTVPRYEGDRCYAPYTVEVSAVTRTPGTDEIWTGPAGTVTAGQGCPVNMEISGGLTSPTDVNFWLRDLGPFDPYSSVPCEMLANDAVIWSGYCGTTAQGSGEGQRMGYSGLEPLTRYDIVLRIHQFVGGPTYSNTVTVDTPAA